MGRPLHILSISRYLPGKLCSLLLSFVKTRSKYFGSIIELFEKNLDKKSCALLGGIQKGAAIEQSQKKSPTVFEILDFLCWLFCNVAVMLVAVL